MKKNLRLLAVSTLGLALVVSLFLILKPHEKFGEAIEQEGEEHEEGIPGVLRSMDLWSSMRMYPAKTMAERGFSQSFEQAARMSIAARSAESKVYSTTTAPWVGLAPKNFAGRVLSLGFHPTDVNTMWVGTAAGGLWKTTNGGTGAADGINWTYVPTGFPVLGVMSIAVHPTDANTIYIGTGEVYDTDVFGGPTSGGNIRTFRGTYGIGILKTTNGGTTWSKVLDFGNNQLFGVAEIQLNPSDPNMVFAATTDGVYRSTDAGANWTRIHNVPLAMDLQFKPGTPSVLYVSCGNFGSAGTGIYKSINATSASPTFAASNTGITLSTGKIMLAQSASAPNTIFASVGRRPDSSDPWGLWRSTNEGASWTQINTASTIVAGTSSLNQGWYAHDIAVSPTSTANILWAEMDFFKSTNSGSTFVRESQWNLWTLNPAIGTLTEGSSTNYVHADIHRIIVSPFNSNHVFALTDGGVFKSTDFGSTFNSYNGGLMTAQIYPNMGLSRQDANFMIGGMQDNEGFVYMGSAQCRRIGALGDGFHAVIHPTNDNICFIESYYLNVFRSTNRSTSFPTKVIDNGQPSTPWVEPAGFNAPFVVAPSNGNIMYAGSNRIRKSTNAGLSFTGVGPSPLSASDAYILYLAVAPSDPNTLYVSVAPGPTSGTRSKLYKSTDGGINYTEITGSLPDRYYSDIAVDAANPNRLAITVSGFGSSHVYLSRDGGTTWSDIGGGLPDIPHNTLMFDPNNRRTLYVGNDLGVFYAHGVPAGTGALPATTSVTWTAYNEGIEDAVLVSDLQVTHTGKLRAATFGRGLWERDLAPSSILPFVFKKFTVKETADGNRLDWSISSQGDVARYEVEYSNDAINFRKVASLAAVSGSGDISYNFLHRITNDMDGFYRIKIINADNSFEYSVVESVKARKLITKLSAYPNPTNGIFKIRIPAESRGALNLRMFDEIGRMVYTKRLEVLPGMQEVPVNIGGLAAGNYQLVCEGYQGKWTTRIIKK